jgi:hypothetical protein
MPARCYAPLSLILVALTFGEPPPDNQSNGNCAQCHACTSPAPGNACLRSCTRSNALQFARKLEARGGPRVVILSELENVYLPVPFDHAGHAEMAQMGGGCVICHHYTPQGSHHPACKTCHDPSAKNSDIAKPGLKGAYHRQCMSCHREWSGESGCDACHQPKTSAKSARPILPTTDDLVGRMHPPIPEPDEELYTTTHADGAISRVLFRHREHIHRYGLRCAECHHQDKCARCHQPGKEHAQQKRTLEQHHQPCIECHRDDACERCHFPESQGPPPPFDHGATGWPLGEYHANRSCRACHTRPPYTARERRCTACHADWSARSFDHAVTGQTLDENHARVDCAGCHPARDFARPPVCDACHDEAENVSFPERRPGPSIERTGE